MFTNIRTKEFNGRKKRSELIFRPEKSFNELAMMQILRCFALEDFDTLENYLKNCNKSELEELFEEKGYQILDATTLKANASAINFIAEKIPTNLAKIALRSKDYKAVKMHLYGETRLEELGKADKARKQLRREFFKAYLQIDKEGVRNILHSSEPSEEIAHLAASIKEDFKFILENTPGKPKITA